MSVNEGRHTYEIAVFALEVAHEAAREEKFNGPEEYTERLKSGSNLVIRALSLLEKAGVALDDDVLCGIRREMSAADINRLTVIVNGQQRNGGEQ